MTSPHPTPMMTQDAFPDLLTALEHLLKTEPSLPIRRAAQRLYIELTEPERKVA